MNNVNGSTIVNIYHTLRKVLIAWKICYMYVAINLCYITVNIINLTIKRTEFRFSSIYCYILIAIRLDIMWPPDLLQRKGRSAVLSWQAMPPAELTGVTLTVGRFLETLKILVVTIMMPPNYVNGVRIAVVIMRPSQLILNAPTCVWCLKLFLRHIYVWHTWIQDNILIHAFTY